MCIACHTAVTSDEFAGELLATLNSAAEAIMISIGHRTGLFDAMADGASLTSHDLAGRAGLHERYVREWLGAMTCARIVIHDRASGSYHLPAAHAALLTRAASPNNLAAVMQWIPLMASVEEEITEAFRHGRGVPYSAYTRFAEVMAEESGQTVVAGLDEHILPLVPDVVRRLEAGIDVLDVGCGVGWALMALAERFPRSRFVGYDLLPEQIERAQAEAESRGLANVRFEARDVAAWSAPDAFDFITTFDAVHDQARPSDVLQNIREALRPGGVYLCQEIKAETAHADNLDHPTGTFIYAISTTHCMSVSLAHGGPGLGAAWGRTLCRSMLADAGFDHVEMHELPHDPMNDFWVCRV